MVYVCTAHSACENTYRTASSPSYLYQHLTGLLILPKAHNLTQEVAPPSPDPLTSYYSSFSHTYDLSLPHYPPFLFHTHLAVLNNAGHVILDGWWNAKVDQLNYTIHKQEVGWLEVRVDDSWQTMMCGWEMGDVKIKDHVWMRWMMATMRWMMCTLGTGDKVWMRQTVIWMKGRYSQARDGW